MQQNLLFTMFKKILQVLRLSLSQYNNLIALKIKFIINALIIASIIFANLFTMPLPVLAVDTSENPQPIIQDQTDTQIDPITREFILAAKKLGVPETTGYRISDPWQVDGKNIITYQKLLLIKEDDGSIHPLYSIEQLTNNQNHSRDRFGTLIPTPKSLSLTSTDQLKNQSDLLLDLLILRNQTTPFSKIANNQNSKLDAQTLYSILRLQTMVLDQWTEDKNITKTTLIGEQALQLGLIPQDKILHSPTLDKNVKEDTIVQPTPLPTQSVPIPTIFPTITPTPKKLIVSVPVPTTEPPVPSSNKVSGAWTGVASYYSRAGCVGCSTGFHMANGETLNDGALTIAFMRAPLNSTVRVTNTVNGRSIIAKVTDTGGFEALGRIADLSVATRDAIGGSSITPVRIELLD